MTHPTSDELRELKRAAHALRARISIGQEGLSDGLVAQVRQALGKSELLKVRVLKQTREEVDALGRELAERVPCVMVGRIGFILTLFRG